MFKYFVRVGLPWSITNHEEFLYFCQLSICSLHPIRPSVHRGNSKYRKSCKTYTSTASNFVPPFFFLYYEVYSFCNNFAMVVNWMLLVPS